MERAAPDDPEQELCTQHCGATYQEEYQNVSHAWAASRATRQRSRSAWGSVAACQAGFSVYFTTLDDMVRKLRVAEATGRFSRQLTAYLRPSVLVVDLCRHRDYAEVRGFRHCHQGVQAWRFSA